MKITGTIICALIICFASTALYGEEQQTLTWKECVGIAAGNNPELISAKEALDQSEADIKIAESSGLPQVGVEVTGRRSKRAEDTESDSYSMSVTGNQLLYDASKTSDEIKEAEEYMKASGYNYSVVSSNVRLDLRAAFVELLYAQEMISLVEDIAVRRRENLKLVELRYNAGREHKGALLTAEADLAQAEFDILQARNSIPLKHRQLLKSLGHDDIKVLRVSGQLALDGDYGARPDIELLADTNPFLKELIAKKEAARYGLRSEKADYFPKVFLNGSAGMASSDFPPDQNEWSVGLSLSIPIFDGGSRHAEVSKARSKIEQAEAEMRGGRDGILLTLEETWKQLVDSITNVSVRKKFLDAAGERARIAGAQYETGLISFDDWIIIENNLANNMKTFLKARADMLLAEAYWIQATGGTLEYDNE